MVIGAAIAGDGAGTGGPRAGDGAAGDDKGSFTSLSLRATVIRFFDCASEVGTGAEADGRSAAPGAGPGAGGAGGAIAGPANADDNEAARDEAGICCCCCCCGREGTACRLVAEEISEAAGIGNELTSKASIDSDAAADELAGMGSDGHASSSSAFASSSSSLSPLPANCASHSVRLDRSDKSAANAMNATPSDSGGQPTPTIATRDTAIVVLTCAITPASVPAAAPAPAYTRTRSGVMSACENRPPHRG